MIKTFMMALLATASVPSQAAVAETHSDEFSVVRKTQSLGRVIADPAGKFFIYEWQRPFDWNPEGKGLPPEVGNRLQTMLYRVRTPSRSSQYSPPTWPLPTSTELFPMAPGATYWLGDLSPDAEWISFYELDRDDNRVKAGIVSTSGDVPSIIWFTISPDLTRLSRVPEWTSDGKALVFPVNRGMARAEASTGKATQCTDCAESGEGGRPNLPAKMGANVDRVGIPAGAKLIASSFDGWLGVFEIDNADALGLYMRAAGRSFTLFENSRKPDH
jgi:hypothetical protein